MIDEQRTQEALEMGDRPTLGLIGLGIWVKPVGRNLLRAGYELVVRDINPEAVAELVAEGAVAAQTSRDVAARLRRAHHDAARLAGRRGRLYGPVTAR
jgi:NAD binding domain of 6-phosphogluconate dehydrogenase